MAHQRGKKVVADDRGRSRDDLLKDPVDTVLARLLHLLSLTAIGR